MCEHDRRKCAIEAAKAHRIVHRRFNDCACSSSVMSLKFSLIRDCLLIRFLIDNDNLANNQQHFIVQAFNVYCAAECFRTSVFAENRVSNGTLSPFHGYVRTMFVHIDEIRNMSKNRLCKINDKTCTSSFLIARTARRFKHLPNDYPRNRSRRFRQHITSKSVLSGVVTTLYS